MKTFYNHDGQFCLLMNYGRSFVSAEEIAFIEGEGNYSTIFNVNGKKIMSAFTLNKFSEHLLQNCNFFIPRKGLLVNLERVHSIEQVDGKLFIVMKSSQKMPLSRRKGKAFIEFIHQNGLDIPIK